MDIKQFKEMKPKKLSIIAMIVICLGLAYGELAAQSKDFVDTVTLKNGTVLNDVKAEEMLSVTTADGKTTVYKKNEVSEVKKGEPKKEAEWSDNLGYLTWEDAKAKCTDLKMRLPTIDELKAAQADNATSSWKKQGYLYWSSTLTTGGAEYPYLLYAFSGEIYSLSRFSNSYTRCIR